MFFLKELLKHWNVTRKVSARRWYDWLYHWIIGAINELCNLTASKMPRLIFFNLGKGMMQEEEERSIGEARMLRPISCLRFLIIRIHLIYSPIPRCVPNIRWNNSWSRAFDVPKTIHWALIIKAYEYFLSYKAKWTLMQLSSTNFFS